MKRIKGWSNIKIHPFTVLYLFFALIVKKIDVYLLALFVVILHEMGHYFMAMWLSFDIEKVEILPFGAFLSLYDYGRHPVIHELLVVLAGPFINLVLLIPLQWLGNAYLIEINRMVMFFNLMPIYPLDGSKVILLVLSYFMNYQNCFRIQIKISVLTICIFMILNKQIGSLIVYLYLLLQNIDYIKNYRFILIQTILNDDLPKKKTYIHYDLLYRRPYENIYYIHQHIYSFEQMKIHVIKSIKNH